MNKQLMQDRKKRKRLLQKKQQKKYRPLPAYLLYQHEAGLEGEMNSIVSPQNAVRAYELLRTSSVMQVPYDTTVGPLAHCWENVEQCISQYGGEKVMGWLVVDDGCENGNRNRLARMSLSAHCVWSHEGRLLDVTTKPPIAKVMGFLPDSQLVGHPCGQSVGFFDSLLGAGYFIGGMLRRYHAYLISTVDNSVQDLGEQDVRPMVLATKAETREFFLRSQNGAMTIVQLGGSLL